MSKYKNEDYEDDEDDGKAGRVEGRSARQIQIAVVVYAETRRRCRGDRTKEELRRWVVVFFFSQPPSFGAVSKRGWCFDGAEVFK